jgi:hypothetical protein
LAVVRIVEMRAVLLLCEPGEAALAGEGRPTLTPGVLDLGGRVSRKKDFVLPLTSACTALVLAGHLSSSSSSSKRKALAEEEPLRSSSGGSSNDAAAGAAAATKRPSATNPRTDTAKDDDGGFFVSG